MSIYSNVNPLILSGITKILAIKDIGNTDIVSVSSEAISEVRYNILTKEMEVTFARSGSTYLYRMIPEHVYEDLVNASSVGQEFVFNIRNTIYGAFYERIG
jgi:hypothetical protein